jgi:hypothetical protein
VASDYAMFPSPQKSCNTEKIMATIFPTREKEEGQERRGTGEIYAKKRLLLQSGNPRM